MNVLKYVVFTFIISFLFIGNTYGEVYTGDELNELKQQMKKMQENVIKMQDKIIELEKRNEELEMKTEETNSFVESQVTQSSQTFMPQGFQSLNPDISLIGVFSAAYYSNDEPVFFEKDPANTGINLQEIEIAFQSVVDPYFRLDSFLAFGEVGSEVEEIYGTSLIDLPLNSQIRVGKMRAKFGRINTQHRHFHNFVTLPIVTARFLGEHLNPTSVETNFLLPFPWYSELSALVGSPEVETPSFDRDSDANGIGKLLYNLNLSNFIEVSDSLGILLGSSYVTGPNGTGNANRTHILGADLHIKYRPLRNNSYQELVWQSEFMYRIADIEEGDINDYGFYTELSYRLSKRWLLGVRYGWINTDDVAEMHDEEGEDGHDHDEDDHDEDDHDEDDHDEDDHDEDDHEHDEEHQTATTIVRSSQTGHVHGQISGDDDEGLIGLFGKEYRISTMLTFTPSEFSLIRLQYDYLDQDFADDQHAVFLQFQYFMGAHGAHSY